MSYYYNAHQQHPIPVSAPAVSHTHHGGRSRRAPRLSVSQNSHKQQQQNHHQYRQIRAIKDMVTDIEHLRTFRAKFEAGRSFDLDDDMEFCPSLVSEHDLYYGTPSVSERSSLASCSPEQSPSQPVQTAPTFSLNASSPSFTLPLLQQHTMKLYQPAATRTRNPIPIVNPGSRSGISMTTPPLPPSASPSMRLPQTPTLW